MPSLSPDRPVGAISSFARRTRRRIGCAAIFAAPDRRGPAGHPDPGGINRSVDPRAGRASARRGRRL